MGSSEIEWDLNTILQMTAIKTKWIKVTIEFVFLYRLNLFIHFIRTCCQPPLFSFLCSPLDKNKRFKSIIRASLEKIKIKIGSIHRSIDLLAIKPKTRWRSSATHFQ